MKLWFPLEPVSRPESFANALRIRSSRSIPVTKMKKSLLALGLCLLAALASQASPPPATPSPSPSVSAAPAVVRPPGGLPASSQPPEARLGPTPPVPPAPNPAPSLPRAVPHPPSLFVSARPDQQRIERAIPQVDVSRLNSPGVQKVARERTRFGRVLLAGNEPVAVTLRFHPLLAGKPITVRPSPEVNLQPAAGILSIAANGTVALQVQMAPTALKGKIFLYADGVPLELPIARVPLSMVVSRETQAGR